jgi:hypothetical protein
MQEDTAMHVLMTPITGSATTDTVGAPLDGELAVLPVAVADAGDGGVFRDRPRHFVGLDSHADACVVEVAELDVTPDVVLAHIQESAARHGPTDASTLVALSTQMAAEMLHVAGRFPVGAILHREGDTVHAIVPILDAPGRRPVCDGGGAAWASERS